MFDLGRLVTLRDRRASRARRVEDDARKKVRAAHAELGKAQDERDAFIEEIRTLEIDLLSALMNTRVTVHDLMAVKEKLDEAERRTQEMEAAIEKAQHAVDEAIAMHEAAQQDAANLKCRLEKSREMHRHLRDLETQSLQTAEDAQLDEISQILAARRVF